MKKKSFIAATPGEKQFLQQIEVSSKKVTFLQKKKSKVVQLFSSRIRSKKVSFLFEIFEFFVSTNF
jgi:hypothetical protein